MTDYKVVVDKSTVPVGTADKVRERHRRRAGRARRAGAVCVVSNPEFLKEGAAVEDFMRPDRIVVGADDERPALLMRALYAPFMRNRDRCW
jgi:UDPglucose 6-dehydrogenase